MDEAWRHYPKWKKPGENGHILWDTILGNVQNKQIHKESKLVVAMAWGGIGNREWPLTGMWFLWGDDEQFLELNSGDGCVTL